MKKIYSLLIVLCICFLSTTNFVFADDFTSAGNGQFAITNYNVDILVNEDNTYLVNETISVRFDVPQHGIIRKIPIKTSLEREDGSESNTVAKVSNIEVTGAEYSTYNEGGYKVVKIGDPDKTIVGNKEFTISYRFDAGKDNVVGKDEFYFNIIGDMWNTTIANVTFMISMPKEFDVSTIGFSSGLYGNVGSEDVVFSVQGNTINGQLNKVLQPSEGLTVRIELPDEYFVGTSSNFDTISIVAISFSIFSVFIAFLLWKKFGVDLKVIETVEFYPPDGFNSADIAFLYKGEASNTDIVSLLIYLANKGYLAIEERKDTFGFKKFFISKLKDYDGDDANENRFFNGIFIKGRDIVTLKQLENNFYLVLNDISANINSKENKEKIFAKNSLNKDIFVTVLMIMTVIMVSINPLTLSSDYTAFIMANAFVFVGIAGFTTLFMGGTAVITVNGVQTNSKSAKKIGGLIFLIMFTVVPFIFLIYPIISSYIVYQITYVLGIVAIFIMQMFKTNMTRRNEYGYDMLCKISGFKNFLETCEKDRLEELVAENPSYFFDILPYTYVLDVSDKWVKNFESIAIERPSWYGGTGRFNPVLFHTHMHSAVNSASSSMSTSPKSSSSGGGFGGGGFSGGGFGGGGGSSW